MVDTVANLFPNVSREAIRRDLSETGSINLTIDHILEERGAFSVGHEGC